MFEEIFTNPGFSHITERILLDLDVRSLLRCTLVNKPLRNFVKSLEGPKLTPKYLKLIHRIRFQRFLVHDRWKAMVEMIFTGKSLSETLIFALTSPQYDDRLFNELQVQCMKIPSSEHVVYRNCFCHSEQFLYTTCSPHVLQEQELLTKICL